MTRLLFVAALGLISVAWCVDVSQVQEEPSEVTHSAAVDEAIGQVMADYLEASGELDLDRLECGEYLDWEAVESTVASFGIEEPGPAGGSAGARGGEMTELTCTFGKEWFGLDNGEFSTRVVEVMLLKGPLPTAEEFQSATSRAGREALVGESDLYDLGLWSDPRLDDTGAVAVSMGDSHSLAAVVRVQVSDADGALELLDAAWEDLALSD